MMMMMMTMMTMMMMMMMMNLALTEYSIAQLQSSLPGRLTPSKARQIQHQSFVAALALAAQHASKAYVFSLQHVIHPTPRVQQCHLKRHVFFSHHFCCNNTAILLFDNPPSQKKLHQKLGLTSPKLHPKLNFSTQQKLTPPKHSNQFQLRFIAICDTGLYEAGRYAVDSNWSLALCQQLGQMIHRLRRPENKPQGWLYENLEQRFIYYGLH